MKFMSLGSNCCPLFFLNLDRVLGPVDNVRGNGLHTIKLLFSNEYYNTVMHYLEKIDKYQMVEKYQKWTHDGSKQDSERIIFKFPSGYIIHNDPREEKFKVELAKRCDRFKEFYENSLTSNTDYFYVYQLNAY